MTKIFLQTLYSFAARARAEGDRRDTIAVLERHLVVASESIAFELASWASSDVIARREHAREHAERLRDLTVIADSVRAALRDARGS